MDHWYRRARAIGPALLLTAALSTGVAGAATLTCGSVITASTVLDADVGPCSGDGLVVGASGVTLNLNGHRVFGTAGPGDNAGIRLQGRTGVTVTGGSVRDFGAGVAVFGGAHNTVARMLIEDNVGL